MWWIFPVTAPVLVYLLWSEIGPSCLVGLFLIFIQPPLQYILGRLYSRLWYVEMNVSMTVSTLHCDRLKSAKATDKRVKVMNEIISGMRLIKMYAWEWAFHEYVKKIRMLVTHSLLSLSLSFVVW